MGSRLAGSATSFKTVVTLRLDPQSVKSRLTVFFDSLSTILLLPPIRRALRIARNDVT